MPDSGAQYLFQGLQNFGQGISDGIDGYYQNKRLDATTTGQIEPYIKNLVAGKDALPDEFANKVDKFTSGKATLNDKITLMGYIQAHEVQRNQDNDQKAQQQNQQIQSLKIQQGQREQAALNQYAQLNQYNQGVGSGVLQPQVQARLQAMGQNPMNNTIASYAGMTGTMPPASIITDAIKRQAGVEQPTGVIYTGPSFDTNGQPVKDIYNRVYRKGDGSIRVDNSTIEVPYHAQAPGTLLDRESFKPVGKPQGTGAPPPASGSPDKLMTPAQQKAIQDANQEYQTLTQNFPAVADLGKAVHAYNSNPGVGNHTNWLLGTDWGLKARNMFGDTTGNNLKGSKSQFASAIMSGVKNVRTQKEFDAMMGRLPDTTDPSDTASTKFASFAKQYSMQMVKAKAYKDALVSGMSPGDAEEAATTTMVNQAASADPTPVVGNAPRGAREWLQANPNDPRAAAIKKKLGL